MPYIYLAEVYYELNLLEQHSSALKNYAAAAGKLPDSRYLSKEFNRIRKAAMRDISIFGDHGDYYLNIHRSGVNSILIETLELIRTAPPLYLRQEEDYAFYEHCRWFCGELKSLTCFYEEMREMRTG